MPAGSRTTRSGRRTTSRLARNHSSDDRAESNTGPSSSKAPTRGRPSKKDPKTAPEPNENSESEGETVQEHGHVDADSVLGKIDSMLSKMRQELMQELNVAEPIPGRPVKNSAARPAKRKSELLVNSEDDSSDSDSSSSSPERASGRKRSKKNSHSKKGAPSPIPVVSASEDEDWGRSRNKFGYLVGKNLSEKIRNKIKSDKYVEMADLLPSSQDKKEDLVMKKSDEGVRFVESKSHRFVDIDKWNQAFRVYMSVYVETAASLGGNSAVLLMKQMLTYQNNINHFARRREPWFLYDKHFRKERAASTDPDLFSDIRHDILLDLDMAGRKDRYNLDQGPNRRRNFRGFDKYGGSGYDKSGGSGPNRQRGPGFCFLFNDEQKRCNRSRCQFKHSCMQCGGGHPKFMCERANAAADNLEKARAASQPSKQPAARQGSQTHRTV